MTDNVGSKAENFWDVPDLVTDREEGEGGGEGEEPEELSQSTLTTEDIDKAISDEMIKIKSALEKSRQEWNNLVKIAESIVLFPPAEGSWTCCLTADQSNSFQKIAANLGILLRYNQPDKQGNLTDKSIEKGKKFVEGYIQTLVSVLVRSDVAELGKILTDACLRGNTQMQFRRMIQRDALYSSGNPLAWFNICLHRRVTDGIVNHFAMRGYEVLNETDPVASEVTKITIKWGKKPGAPKLIDKKSNDEQ